jgi:uncharacterized YkwD family protein
MISRKKILVMFITMIMLILFSTIFSYSTKNYKPTYGVTTTRVNFRKVSNLERTSIVKVLPTNTKIKIVGEISTNYIVQLQNNQVGLVAKAYCKLQGTSLPNALIYQSITPYYASINGNYTYVRSGPATTFTSYTRLNKGEKIQVIGKINNFNLIVTSNNLVGMIRSDLITKISTTTNTTTPTPTQTEAQPKLDALASEVFTLINNARKENGLTPYKLDGLTVITAKQKSNDMVEKNYFSHTSPTYGSPFEMLKKAGVSYKSAGENIAGNPSIKGAVNSWLASTNHRANILSPNYNYIGIGVTRSNTYGYVIVTMFIQK